MERKGKQQVEIKKSLYHFCGWLFFYYFWYRYFMVSGNELIAYLLALITTFFSAFTFYIASYHLISSFRKVKKLIWFIIIAVLFIVAMSFLRTMVVVVTDRLFSAKTPVLHFMGQFFTSVFHISYAFVFAAAVSLYSDKHKQQLRSEKGIKERLAAELEFLKNQVNPHFLFNIHNSIYFLIHEHPDAAEKAVLMLSEIMRYQLYECNDASVSLQKELHNISNYIELEKIRTGNKIKIDYRFPNMDADFQIAPFILLSLVENAFKHISHFPDKPNFINISAAIKENDFYLSVVNSTEEYTYKNDVVLQGIGLKNLSRRLELIYGNRFELFLSGENNFFSANLKLPEYDIKKPDY